MITKEQTVNRIENMVANLPDRMITNPYTPIRLIAEGRKLGDFRDRLKIENHADWMLVVDGAFTFAATDSGNSEKLSQIEDLLALIEADRKAVRHG
ncbi:hypothetical protein [Neorhodopirellula pilleata]|uniref:Uncharacterized protein n=1 Tax=Neorhodopirellula pilleata TaxID=2714738 RepID=A0A5C5ZV98_9BACT|nr:hypothetical protein [Neorhodopirellula pilleata]TWT91423.1 hypothetical protein Pla100_52730 [Neorhodopirellula pilleata]TWT91472.1 hypothetical protein Pla100_53220 [Neorhodopirellula pilleata]